MASRIVARLSPAFPILDDIDATDLPAVADAIAGLEGGESALLQAIVGVAEFTTATPNYAHKLLSVLMLEGVVDVLTTNWDNCIERGSADERPSAVVTSHDLSNITPPSVLKIHGCATQPQSLLVTSAHLAAPPQWVIDETRHRLGAATVAFVGIGDIAGYVRLRIAEAISGVGAIENIRVVSPGIVTGWTSSPWAELIPDLAATQRIAATADEFLEQLGRAYVLGVLGDIALEFADHPNFLAAVRNAQASITANDALRILVWARRAAVMPHAGVAVFDSESMTVILCALGVLLPGGFYLDASGTVRAPETYLQILVSSGRASASRMQREAQNRLSAARTEGREVPRFLVAGGIGWGLGPTLPADILDEGRGDDVLDGPLNQRPDIQRAEDVLA
ncbi:SIR2 family protein [Microbacterium sp. DT81.1]|uniref:SIR2 family protein n=1 Tax=Microbacterium sp. DT81.1 TaxID=3393413 RepID=UPI003CF4D2D9